MPNDPFLAIDRAHEKAGVQADDFNEALSAESTLQTAALRMAATAGDEQVLADLADSLSQRLCADGVTEQLIRTALSCGPMLAGVMFLDLVSKCIFDDAGALALVEIERTEKERVAA